MRRVVPIGGDLAREDADMFRKSLSLLARVRNSSEPSVYLAWFVGMGLLAGLCAFMASLVLLEVAMR